MTLRDKLRQKGSDLKDKIGTNARSAERGASKRAQGVRERLKEVDTEDARRVARRAGEHVGNVEVGATTSRDREPLDRAEDAATMGPPVDATLNPVTSPEDIGNFATASPQNSPDDAQQADLGVETVDDGFGLGTGDVDDFGTAPRGSVDDMVSFGQSPDQDEQDEFGDLGFGDFGEGFELDDDEGWF